MPTSLYHLVQNLNTELVIPENGIISRTIHQDDQLKVMLFGFSNGHEMSEHTAPVPAIMHFLQGRAEITLGVEKSNAGEGAWVHMAANLPHSILAKSPVLMLLILVKMQVAVAPLPAAHTAV